MNFKWYNYSMENLDLIIAKNLTFLRKKNKFTQASLAEKLNYSDKAISKWEKGESLPPIEVLYKISKLYGVSLDFIVGEEKYPQVIKTVDMKKRYLHITLLSILTVWFVAVMLFVGFDILANINLWIVFTWAVPCSIVVGIVFDCIWNKQKTLFYLISALIWTTLICFLLQFSFGIWKILLIGIPLQIATFLCSRLVKK